MKQAFRSGKFIRAVILAVDLTLGLLLVCAWFGQGGGRTQALQAVSSTHGNVATELKKIALTFDDGPHPTYTPLLLDGLLERGVCASFFVTGENAEQYPELILRMQAEGHLIGNHTYSHIQLSGTNREAYRAELVQTNEILQQITGEEVQYVRPPYGSWDKSFEAELNMFPVLWTIDPLDWCSRDADSVAQRVLSKAGEYDIILLHDEYESTVTAALQIVDTLLEQGYTFVTVDEIIFD